MRLFSGAILSLSFYLVGVIPIAAEEINDARFHQSLGDSLRAEGRLEEALKEYEEAKALGGENIELLKDIGTVQKWLRNYKAAEASYTRALELDPKDQEARDDLNNLRLKRGLQIKGWIGGWEPDYTKEGYETMLFYGGLNRLDLNAGYSYSDQVYYNRKKVYTSGYYFYRPDSYLKLYLVMKDYNYPNDPALQKPAPDSNSYDRVPSAEVEVSHWIKKSLRGTLAYELFTPTFFYDKSTTAKNQKISAELYYLPPLDFLRAKLIYALLRDPDPDTTEIKGRDNLKTPLGIATATNVEYHDTSLLGGALEFNKEKWNADVKYLPNRDLDNSYKYSFLTGVGYKFNRYLSGRMDYVYDKYSTKSNYAGKTATVSMASAFYEINPIVDLGIGYKYIDIPRGSENTGFLSLSYKTGLGF